ncbi:MAG: DUF371 domain-containing protein [Candidatus Methanomethylicia archaeon]
MIIEEVIAYGHPNIVATHKSTFEITKESILTKKGDCIIGIRANKACKDFSEKFKEALKGKVLVKVILKAGNFEDHLIGYGDPRLTLSDDVSIVIRKSNYVCPRTLLINASKAACDINRNLISHIRRSKDPIQIIFMIES